MNKPCFMLAKQRSGTRVFGRMLGSHPAIAYCSEVFHESASDRNGYFNFIKRQIERDADNLKYIYPDRRQESFQAFLDYMGEEYGKDKFVLDLKYNQLHHLNDYWYSINNQPQIFRFIKQNKYPVIHLIRRNVLKVLVSQTLASKHQIWHAKPEHLKKIKDTTIKLNPATIFTQLNTRQKEINRISSFFKNYNNGLTLYYEDLFDESQAFSQSTVKALSELLEVDGTSFNTEPFYVKQTSLLTNVIENFYEIKESLQNTEFEYCL